EAMAWLKNDGWYEYIRSSTNEATGGYGKAFEQSAHEVNFDCFTEFYERFAKQEHGLYVADSFDIFPLEHESETLEDVLRYQNNFMEFMWDEKMPWDSFQLGDYYYIEEHLHQEGFEFATSVYSWAEGLEQTLGQFEDEDTGYWTVSMKGEKGGARLVLR